MYQTRPIRYSQPMTVNNGGCTACSVFLILFGAFFSIPGFVIVSIDSDLTVGIICFPISTICIILGCCVCRHIIKTRRRQKPKKSNDTPSNAELARKLERLERQLDQQSTTPIDVHPKVHVQCLIIILFAWLI